MHDIWNPWHGCVKVSEGCAHCYMYFLDRRRGADGGRIYRTGNFDYPLQRTRSGSYRVRSGEQIRVCMTSDFFLPEADKWRREAWSIIRERPDVCFFLLTKRPERVADCLPPDWGEGWDNVFFNVTCENQLRADQRIPLLLSLPFRHKGIMTAPLLGEIHIESYLEGGQIRQVIAGGENYDGARPCDFDWVRSLSAQCRKADVTFCFIETGTNFIKDGRTYHIADKRLQSRMAWRAQINHAGRPPEFRPRDRMGFELDASELHKPRFGENCVECGSRPICNGCSRCGKCGTRFADRAL